MSIDVIVNSIRNATAMVDNGCCTYAIVCEKLVQELDLPRFPISPVQLEGVSSQKSSVRDITELLINVGGVQCKLAAYIVPSTYDYDMILGRTWLKDMDGIIDESKQRLYLNRYQISLPSTEKNLTRFSCAAISAAAFQMHVRQNKQQQKVQIFAASLKDIEKALRPKTPLTPDEVKQALPSYLQSYAPLFTPKEGEELPPLKGKDVDH